MRAHQRQRGFTLTEVMVATAIFTIIMLAALLMYDRNNRVFKSGVQASDVQQNTRVGFDKLVSDLRIEGFDYDRNGSPTGADPTTLVNYQQQPDEQIEYMGDAAIAFRANFNYNTGYDNGREGCKRTNPAVCDPNDTYESPAFPLVTTANNEIVIYALQSNSGNQNANKSTISFFADVAKPRAVYLGTGGENKERQVVISGYDTTNNYPPYTLYRLTLRDSSIADSATDAVGSAVPIATNVRSLKFQYYGDQSGATTALTPVYGDGQFDASNPFAAILQRTVRSSIQSIHVALIGMEAAPENGYSSPLETSTGITDGKGVPAASYRQYQLTSLIVPRNVGKRDIQEEPLKRPDPAVLQTICYGACAVPYLTWQAPVSGNVDFYAIIYDTDPNGTFSNGYPVGNVTSAYFPRPLNPGVKYYFRIESSNGYGDAQSNVGSITAVATTTPGPPANLAATSNLANRIRLTWQTPANYGGSVQALTCFDPSGSQVGTNLVAQNGIAGPERIAYRIFRSTNQSFDPSKGEGEKIADELSGNQPFVDLNGVATFDDYVPDCIMYYYRVQAVAPDCVGKPEYNLPAQTSVSMSDYDPLVNKQAIAGKAISAASPAAPTNFTVSVPTSCQPGTLRGANVTCSIAITFNKVTQDTSSPAQPVKIDSYTLTRTQLQPGSGTTTFSIPGDWDPLSTTPAYIGGNTISYTDVNVPMTDAAGHTYQYRYDLVAKNACTPDSAAVSSTNPSSYFVIATEPVSAGFSDAGDGSFATPYQLYPGQSTLTFKATGMTSLWYYVNDAQGGPITSGPGSGSPVSFTIPPGLPIGPKYSVDFVAQNASGAYYTETVFFTVQGGVCDYTTAPSAVPTPTQVNNGLTKTTPWSLQPNQTIKWSASDLASSTIVLTNLTTKAKLSPSYALTGTTETFSWPTLTYGTTYQVDATLQNVSPGCQRLETYFVTQVCAGYSGGTAVFTVSDGTHTGLTTSSAWQILTGGTIKVTESKMTTLTVTVTDLTKNTSPVTVSSAVTGSGVTLSSGVATITWPPTGVTGVNNDVFQVDMVLADSSGCTSSTYTRYVTQNCAYSGTTPSFTNFTNTQTLRNSSDVSGNGQLSTTPLLMVPLVDVITVTESAAKTVYVDYFDPSTLAPLSGVSTQTWTGSSPIKFNNPNISGENGKTYGIKITLADSNGCKSSTTTLYVKQVPCVLKPQQTSGDSSVIGSLSNNNKSNVLTISNKSNQTITINSITLGFTLTSGTTLTNLSFPTSTVAVGASTGPTTVLAPSGTTIPALSSINVTVNYSAKQTNGEPLTDVCVTYTTSANTPSSPVTQSCNIQYSASNSVLNPTGCD